jgi:hypothetical protein
MVKELLPCPFCGKKPKVFQDEDPYSPGGPIPTDFVIYCCVEMRAASKKEAFRKWNRRKNGLPNTGTNKVPKT